MVAVPYKNCSEALWVYEAFTTRCWFAFNVLCADYSARGRLICDVPSVGVHGRLSTVRWEWDTVHWHLSFHSYPMLLFHFLGATRLTCTIISFKGHAPKSLHVNSSQCTTTASKGHQRVNDNIKIGKDLNHSGFFSCCGVTNRTNSVFDVVKRVD